MQIGNEPLVFDISTFPVLTKTILDNRVTLLNLQALERDWIVNR